MSSLGFVPFEADERVVRIASGNPLLKLELAELERICGRKIEPFLCREEIPRTYLEALAQTADTQRRSHPRFRVSLPAAFQCYSQEGTTVSETVFRGRTLDISAGGLQVSGPLILGMDPDEIAAHPVKMVVTIGAVPQDIVTICETRHVRLVRGSGGGTSCIYGLKVSHMSSTHRDILGSMIARIHRAQPQDALN
jgi:c-di-GMP-binding flagellar brake protein YcgR